MAEEKPPEDSAGKDNIIKILNEEKKALQDEVEKLTQTSNASKVRGDKNRNTVPFKRSWIGLFFAEDGFHLQVIRFGSELWQYIGNQRRSCGLT